MAYSLQEKINTRKNLPLEEVSTTAVTVYERILAAIQKIASDYFEGQFTVSHPSIVEYNLSDSALRIFCMNAMQGDCDYINETIMDKSAFPAPPTNPTDEQILAHVRKAFGQHTRCVEEGIFSMRSTAVRK